MVHAYRRLHVEEGADLEEKPADTQIRWDARNGFACEERTLQESDTIGRLLCAFFIRTGTIHSIFITNAFSTGFATTTKVATPDSVDTGR